MSALPPSAQGGVQPQSAWLCTACRRTWCCQLSVACLLPGQIAPIRPAEVPGSWLTGISEVQLPAHYKLKNIEETEAVKQRMLQGGHDSKCAAALLAPSHSASFWQCLTNRLRMLHASPC